LAKALPPSKPPEQETGSVRAAIRLTGGCGRTSGPDVHYEVIVNGQPHDREKFIELAHLVPIAEK
jgi:hypothetical protein